MKTISLLNQKLAALGFHRKRPGRVLSELVFHLATTFVGIAFVVLAEPLWLRSLGFVVMVLGSLGVATNTHTSSHYATSNSRRLDRVLTYFGYPVFLGMSASYWWHKHVVVHHPTPNVVGLDDDIDVLPFFALAAPDAESASALRRWWYRHQWLIVPFAIALNAWNMKIASLRHLAERLRDRPSRSASVWIDLACVTAHYGAWIGLPMLWFAPLEVVVFYTLWVSAMGYAIFAAFAPAHFPVEASFLSPQGKDAKTYFKDADFVKLQTLTTVNFRTGWYGRLLCSGVDYQIEHHLFPGISHAYYPRLSPILRDFCRQQGYPYRTLGWGEAIRKSLATFRHPKPVARTLEVAPDSGDDTAEQRRA